MSAFEEKVKWLAALQAGDVVGVSGGFSGIPQERKVDRTTATQIIVGNRRYSKKDGYAIGSYSRFSRPNIVMITSAVREQIERRDLISWASTRNWNGCTTDQLRAVKKAYDEAA